MLYVLGLALVTVLVASGAVVIVRRIRIGWSGVLLRLDLLEGVVEHHQAELATGRGHLGRVVRELAETVQLLEQRQQALIAENRQLAHQLATAHNAWRSVADQFERIVASDGPRTSAVLDGPVLDRLRYGQGEPVSEVYCYFGRADGADQTPSEDAVRIADLLVFTIAVQRANPAADPFPDADRLRQLIVIERTVWTGSADQDLAELGPAASDGFQHAFDEVVRKKIVDPSWRESTDFWMTPAYDGAAALADGLSMIEDSWPGLVLGEPAEVLAEHSSLHPLVRETIADIAEHDLPTAEVIKAAQRVVQFTGIVAGFASDAPALTNACLKSVVADVVAERVAKRLADLAGETLQLAGTRQVDAATQQELAVKLAAIWSDAYRAAG